jgi:hypothetical protein
MPSPYSEKWDAKKTPRGEPSNRFYDIVISFGVGGMVGMVITAWIFLG